MEKQEKTIEIPLSVYQNFLKQAKQMAELKQQVEWLTGQFRLARHKQFGVSSEQTDDGQLCLFNEAEQTAGLTTLARDIHLFALKGFKTMEATPVDMFPRTAHVECVALLERIMKTSDEKTGK